MTTATRPLRDSRHLRLFDPAERPRKLRRLGREVLPQDYLRRSRSLEDFYRRVIRLRRVCPGMSGELDALVGDVLAEVDVKLGWA